SRSRQMLIEPLVGFRDQSFVEAPLATSGLVSGDQQNCLPFRVESKSHSPDTALRVEPKLLHIGVDRTFQRIDAGAPKDRTELLKPTQLRQQFVLNLAAELVELRLEQSVESYRP